MFRLTRVLSLGLLLVGSLMASLAAAAQKEPPKPRDAAEPSVLKARLVVNEDAYSLSPEQRGEAFRKSLEAAGLGEVPEPPKVDLVLELTNPTDKPVSIMVGADNGGLELVLEGPGAISVDARRAFTREFRFGKEVKIAPGETYEMPIMQLKYGFRGVGKHAYWTEPGEYTLAAIYRWPAPGADPGGKPMTLSATAKPVKLTVKAAR